MRRGGCSKAFVVITVIAVAVVIISNLVSGANKAKQAKQADADTPKPVVVDDGLVPYVNDAKALATELDTKDASSDILMAFNDRYEKGYYQQAYAYYLANMSGMRKSCWAMNNVGLTMLQLGRDEEALPLYLAIQMKTKGSQPESLINLLVAGHTLGFGPRELMDAAGMDAELFRKNLESKAYDQATIDGMIRSLCYNIIYMRMEEPAVGTSMAVGNGVPDIDALLSQTDPGEKLMSQLRAISSTDQDVQALLAYFEALLKLRGEQAAS